MFILYLDMANYLSSSDEHELIDRAIIHGDFTLASGAKATEKFDFDLIETNSDIFRALVQALSRYIKAENPDIDGIVTVANGATRLGDPISAKLGGIEHIQSSYTTDEDGVKNFSVGQIPDGVTKVVLVDDVFTRGTNTTKVANALPDDIEIAGVVVILDRSGQTAPQILGSVAVVSLIRKVLK